MLSESETESKQKNQEKQGSVSLLICLKRIPNTKT